MKLIIDDYITINQIVDVISQKWYLNETVFTNKFKFNMQID